MVNGVERLKGESILFRRLSVLRVCYGEYAIPFEVEKLSYGVDQMNSNTWGENFNFFHNFKKQNNLKVDFKKMGKKMKRGTRK